MMECEPVLDSICEIPLRSRDGAARARVRVDPDDWLALARYSWFLTRQGYAASRLTTRYTREKQRGRRHGGAQRLVAMHRLLAGLEPGDRRKVDHINRDRLDCRRSNLRIVNDRGNGENVSPQRGRTSVYRGVAWYVRDGRWQAYASLNRRRHHLGYFDSEEEAAAVAAAFRAAHMPHSADAHHVT